MAFQSIKIYDCISTSPAKTSTQSIMLLPVVVALSLANSNVHKRMYRGYSVLTSRRFRVRPITKIRFMNLFVSPRYCVRTSINSIASCSPNVSEELVILSLKNRRKRVGKRTLTIRTLVVIINIILF